MTRMLNDLSRLFSFALLSSKDKADDRDISADKKNDLIYRNQDAKKLLRYLFVHHESLSFLLAMEYPALSVGSEEYFIVYVLLGALRMGMDMDFRSEYEQGNPSIPYDSLLSLKNRNPLLYEEAKRNPSLYLSLECEMPRFIVSELLSAYSYAKTERMLLALRKKPNRFYLSRGKDTNRFLSDARLDPIRMENGLVLFQSKEALKEESLFPVLYPYGKLLSSLSFPPLGSKTMVISPRNEMDGVYLSFLVEEDFNSIVIPVFENRRTYLSSRDHVKDGLRLKPLSPELVEDGLLLSRFEKESMDFVIYSSKSHVGASFLYPESLASLTKEHVKENGELALKELKKGSMFVKKDGYLVYYSNSFLSLETKEVIAEFLSLYPKFALDKEETVDPSIQGTTAGYYAILRRISP